MRRLIERCAGLDVHRDTVAACVRVPGDGGERQQEVRTFGTTTAQLVALREWLVDLGITLVGMESTGIYWRPVFAQLEDHVECWLLNAEHLHNVPGRKTDVADSVWICELTEHGLVRLSFVPPKPIRVLRDLTRYRTVVVKGGRESQRLHKVLEDAGIKLSSVTSRVLTASGRDMIDALVAGTRDPEVLAELARGRMRPKIPQLKEALEGRFAPEHALVAARMLARIDHAEEVITELSEKIGEAMAPWEHQVELLVSIPGVGRRIAEVLIAEISPDMGRFPSSAHLASWAGMCPGTGCCASSSGWATPSRSTLRRRPDPTSIRSPQSRQEPRPLSRART